MSKRSFEVDTKGACLLCLTRNGKKIRHSPSWSLLDLSRFLKVDFHKVFNVSGPNLLTTPDALENTEMLVSVCQHCTTVLQEFGELVEELERVRLKLKGCVNKIHDVMVKAEQDTGRLEEYRQLLTEIRNPVELINASIAENLRKETVKKCASHVWDDGPAVALREGDVKQKTESEKLTSDNEDDNGSQDDDDAKSVDSSNHSEQGAEDETGMNSDEDYDETDSLSVDRLTLGDKKAEKISTSSGISETDSQKEQVVEKEPKVNHSVEENGVKAITPSRDPLLVNNAKKDCDSTVGINKENKAKPDNQTQRQTAVDTLRCTFCPQTFQDKPNLQKHEVITHCSSKFLCVKPAALPMQDFECAVAALFQEVLIKCFVKDLQTWVCIFGCDKRLENKMDVRYHMMVKHWDALKLKLIFKLRELTNKKLPLLPTSTNSKVSKPTSSVQSSNQASTVAANICPECHLGYGSSKLYHMVESHLFSFFKIYCKDTKIISDVNFRRNLETLLERLCSNKQGKDWLCTYCDKRLSKQIDLRIHLIEAHHAKLVLSKLSSSPTSSACRSLGGGYSCKHCGSVFVTYYGRRVHLFQSHRVQVFTNYFPTGTSADEMNTVLQQLFLEHMNVEEDGYGCDWCERSFIELPSLQNHILLDHFSEVVARLGEYHDGAGGTIKKSDHAREQESQEKETVGSTAGDKNGKDDGKVIVLDKKPKQVSKSGKSVSTTVDQNKVDRQILLEFRQNKNRCPVCDKETGTMGRFMDHFKKSHGGEAKLSALKCSVCSESFWNKASLLIHEMLKHRVSKFLNMRPPAMSMDGFELIVESIFEESAKKNFAEDGILPWSCLYCSQQRFKERVDIHCHLIQAHYDILREKLSLKLIKVED